MVENKVKSLGFTIIELLLGMALFGLIVPSIIFSVVSINRLNDRAGDLSYANIIAENKMETLRSVGFTSISLGTVDFTSELPRSFDSPRNATYTISSSQAGLKEVELQIVYYDHGQNTQLEYKTTISELGVAQ